jgi:uncharacterized protein with GYD domain
MVTFITFAKFTEKGQVYPPEKAPEILNKVTEIAQAYGGRILNIWATGGRYDFVTLTQYPDQELAFKARTKILELGLFHLDSTPVFPVETFLEAVAEKKVLVTA